MPLPLLKLDDRTFTDLVDELRAIIPRHMPAWTNHNISDPGIMFMELFAWLTENTLYRINRVTPASRTRFLELLGGVFAPAQPALIQLTLTAKGLSKPWTIEPGTEITARIDQYGTTVPFETIDTVRVTPNVPVATLTARQSVVVKEENLGISTGKCYQRFVVKQSAITLPAEPFPRPPQLWVDGVPWEFRPDLSTAGNNGQIFTIKPWLNALLFGSGKDGRPVPGATITLRYRTNTEQPRVVQDSWVNTFSDDVTQLFRLRHPVLLLDLQPIDDFEPLIQVGAAPWHYRSRFLELGKAAPEFTVEPWSNAIRFGGSKDHGAIPDVASPIKLTYRYTLGAQGNLPRGTTFTIKPEAETGVVEVAVDKAFKLVRNGVDRVDLAEVRDQVFDLLKPRWRAITERDFQEVITTRQRDVIKATPVAAQDLTGPQPDCYRPGHVSVLLTPGALYELTKPSATFNQHQQISPDGRRLLTLALADTTESPQPAQLWDLADQRPIDAFSVNRLHQAHFSPDSRRLVTTDSAAVARLWNADDGALITFLQPTLRGLAWRQGALGTQDPLVAADSGGTVVTWAFENSSVQATIAHGSYDSRMALSANGERLATVKDDNVVMIWDTQQTAPLLQHQHAILITMIALSADGRLLAVADDTHKLALYNVADEEANNNAELLWDRQAACPVTALTLDSTGALLAYATNDGQIWCCDIASKQCTNDIYHDTAPNLVLFDRKGELLLVADGDGNATLWKLDDATCLANFAHAQMIYAAAIDPAQRYVVTACADQQVRLWDRLAPAATEPTCLAHDGPVYALTFSANGTRLATAGREGTIRIWSIDEEGQTPSVRQILVNPITSYCFAPQQPWLVTITRDRHGWLWDGQHGVLIGAVSGPAPVTAVRFSPAGNWLATNHADNSVRLWEAATGRLCDCFTHAATVTALCFSPIESLLATCDETRSVRLWQVQPQAKPEGPTQPFATLPLSKPLQEVVWSADGARIITVANEARLWSARTGKPLALLITEAAAPTVTALQIDPTVRLIAATLQSGSGEQATHELHVWSARDGKWLAKQALTIAANTIRFHPSGERLLLLGAQHTAAIWSLRLQRISPPALALRELLTRPVADDGWIHDAGHWLATRQDNLLLVWDGASGRLLSTFYHEHGDCAERKGATITALTPTVTAGALIVTKFSREQVTTLGSERVTTLQVWNAEQVAAVRTLLDERKLIATHPHVAGVAYTNVWIKATVVRQGTAVDPGTIQKNITTALRAFFHPHTGGPQQRGWPLGRTVYASEVYQLIEGIAGVDHVEQLTLATTPITPRHGSTPVQPPIVPSSNGLQSAVSQLQIIELPPNHLVNCHVQPADFPVLEAELLAGRGRRKPETLEKAP